MPMWVNRIAVEQETAEKLLLLQEYPSPYFIHTVHRSDLLPAGQELLATLLVEGEPADGITRNAGRTTWSAYRRVK